MTIVEQSVSLILAIPAALHAIIAEVTPSPLPDRLGDITQISAFGLVAWIVYYMFSKWLPAIQEAHSRQLEAQRVAHVEAMNGIAEAHKTAIERMTTDFKESLSAQRSDLLAIRAICRLEQATKP